MTTYKDDILSVASLELPWEKLKDCNILISGATGLIGSCIVEVLMLNPKKNYCIFAMGRDEERAKKRFSAFLSDASFHFFSHDVVEPLKEEIQFDYIIHAASEANPKFFTQQPVEVMRGNIYGLDHLLSYGLQHGMRRLLFVSSGEVYGEGDGRVFTEDYSGYVDCTSPRSCYPSSKRATETLCSAYKAEYDADVVMARPSYIYGPHFTESDDRVCAQFIRNVLNDEDIVMKSTGEQYRSWCYVVDCVSALLYILLKGETGQAYNIADPESNICIRDLAGLVAKTGGKKVVIDIPAESDRRGYAPVAKSVFSTEKLEALGWSPKTHIAEGIIKTIEELHT